MAQHIARKRFGQHFLSDRRTVQQIVRGGLFVSRGMPSFADRLSEADVRAIQAYLIDTQGQLRTHELRLQAEGKPLDAQALTIMSNY